MEEVQVNLHIRKLVHLYTKEPELLKVVNQLNQSDRDKLDYLIDQVRDTITKYSDGILDHLGLKFPLDAEFEFWYEEEPEWWLVMNSLPYLEDEVLRKIIKIFQTGID